MRLFFIVFLISFTSCRGLQDNQPHTWNQPSSETTLWVPRSAYVPNPPSKGRSSNFKNSPGSLKQVTSRVLQKLNSNAKRYLLEETPESLSLLERISRDFNPSPYSGNCTSSFTVYPCIFGKGGAGVIWLTRTDGVEYIIKVFNSASINNEFVAREIAPFKILGKHENIIDFIGAFRKNNNELWNLVLEKGDNALNYFPIDKLTPKNQESILKGIINGVSYMSSKGISHGDIKEQNIVYFLGSNDSARVKIIDFGAVTGKTFNDDGYVSGGGTTIFYSILSEFYLYFNFRPLVHLTSDDVNRGLKRNMLTQVVQSINNAIRDSRKMTPSFSEPEKTEGELIGVMASYLKESFPSLLSRSAQYYQDDWNHYIDSSYDGWKNVLYQYIKKYDRSMGDVHSVGMIIKNFERFNKLASPIKANSSSLLLKKNPFERPKISEVWGAIAK